MDYIVNIVKNLNSKCKISKNALSILYRFLSHLTQHYNEYKKTHTIDEYINLFPKELKEIINKNIDKDVKDLLVHSTISEDDISFKKIIDYLLLDILDLSCNFTMDCDKVVITPYTLFIPIICDPELQQLPIF